MSYLITQLWVCLLGAAIIGAATGYLLARSTCRNRLEDLEESWRSKLEDKENDYSRKLKKASKSSVAADTTQKILIAEQTSYKVEEIEGIGENYSKKLHNIGIFTTEQLLNQCCNINGRITVAEHVGIEDFVVSKWASMSDLMRISGIEGQVSELMVYAGIDSVQNLGQQNTDALHSKLISANQEQQRVKIIPDKSALELIINQAKSIKAMIQDT